MKVFLSVLCLMLQVQSEVAFKSAEEFELTLEYAFKTRSHDPNNVSTYGQTATQLPYLILNLQILKLASTESRIRVVDNFYHVLLNKKASANDIFKLDMGFTDDMKDRVTADTITILFLASNKKDVISKIVIHVKEDGTFLVNDERRGRF